MIRYLPSKLPSIFRKISFRFRTRASDSTNMLTISSAKHELKIYMKTSRINIEYRLSPSTSVITVDRLLDDALWHSVQAEFLESTLNIAIDGQAYSQEVTRSDVALSTILLEENAFVQMGGGFIGCLDDVRLGPHLLPVFPEGKPRTAQVRTRIPRICDQPIILWDTSNDYQLASYRTVQLEFLATHNPAPRYLRR